MQYNVKCYKQQNIHKSCGYERHKHTRITFLRFLSIKELQWEGSLSNLIERIQIQFCHIMDKKDCPALLHKVMTTEK